VVAVPAGGHASLRLDWSGPFCQPIDGPLELAIGLVLAPTVPRIVRAVADRERARLSRWGPEIIGAEPLPAGLPAALTDPAVRREFGWVGVHGTFGFVMGLLGLALPLYAVQDVTFPLWFWLVPAERADRRVAAVLRYLDDTQRR
jgi:hypothetical protein